VRSTRHRQRSRQNRLGFPPGLGGTTRRDPPVERFVDQLLAVFYPRLAHYVSVSSRRAYGRRPGDLVLG